LLLSDRQLSYIDKQEAVLGWSVLRVRCLRVKGDRTVHKSIFDAIKEGEWDYEPEHIAENRYRPTGAMPGTREKLSVLADRIQSGLPLWHGHDRTDYDDEE
jgi:hypothetical protein